MGPETVTNLREGDFAVMLVKLIKPIASPAYDSLQVGETYTVRSVHGGDVELEGFDVGARVPSTCFMRWPFAAGPDTNVMTQNEVIKGQRPVRIIERHEDGELAFFATAVMGMPIRVPLRQIVENDPSILEAEVDEIPAGGQIKRGPQGKWMNS